MNNNALNSALRQAARRLSVDPKLVEGVYRSYWRFIREHVDGMRMKEMTQEEFDAATTNFNLPFIGKLYADKEKINKYNRQLKFLQKC